MLIRLTASNFLSIDDPIEFSMLASKEARHGQRVAEVAKPAARLLQVAALWGGNASGKSNLCKVLDFCQHMVVQGTKPDALTGRIPFKLRESAASEPSRFEFEILVEDGGREVAFRYIFAVNGKVVVEESLAEMRPVADRTYFTRTANPDGSNARFTLDWWEKKSVAEDDRQFAKYVAKGTKVNQLFLHEALDRNLTLMAPVFRWFRDQLTVIGPNDDLLPLEIQEPQRVELREYLVNLLDHADTGVTVMESVEVPASNMGFPNSLLERFEAKIKTDEGMMFKSPHGDRFTIFKKDGELLIRRMVTYRNSADGNKVLFEPSEESDGTLRLIELAPLFFELDTTTSRKVFVVDELDRSMHCQLTTALLQNYFSSCSSGGRSQLIFTTHDAMLMDQDLLRRDEMWFIERGKNGQTQIESLADYKDVRHDKDVRKAYLEGRYSGVPRLRTFGRRKVSSVQPPAAVSM